MAGFGTALALGLTGLVAFGLASSKKKPSVSVLSNQPTDTLYQGAMNAPTTDPNYYNQVAAILEARGESAKAAAVRKRAASLGVQVPTTFVPPTIQPSTPIITTPPFVPPPTAGPPVMTAAMKKQIDTVLRALGIDPSTNQFVSVPTEAAIQAATLLSAQLEAQGFHDAAQRIKLWAIAARAQLKPKPPIVEPTPAIPDWLRERVDAALKLERNPRVLRLLANELKKLPAANTPEVKALIGMLEQTAANAEQALANAQTATEIENIMVTTPPDFTIPPPTVTPPIITPPVITPPVITPPIITPPQVLPKSERQMAAEEMVRNLLMVQGSGSVIDVRSGKGKEDQSLVRRFQALDGQKTDGKAGPGTLLSAARAGVCRLPLVQYWPRGATSKKVTEYRSNLRSIAATKLPNCRVALEDSATRERGQAGIAGPMPS
jgi:hypothetical protein